MSFRSLLNTEATIKRMSASKDTQGVIRKNPIEQLVGTFPCSISKQSAKMEQGTPQATESISYLLCFMPNVDVQTGDLAIVPQIGKLRLSKPYHVRNHHIEVSGAWEGDV